MSAPDDDELGFAPDYDAPIPYMHRIRTYYQTLGYGAPYRWAHYRDVPFTPMTKPLGEATIALVTTAAPYRPEAGDQGPGAPYNSAAKFYKVYSGDSADGSRPAHLPHRHRPQAHHGRGLRHVVSAAGAA